MLLRFCLKSHCCVTLPLGATFTSSSLFFSIVVWHPEKKNQTCWTMEHSAWSLRTIESFADEKCLEAGSKLSKRLFLFQKDFLKTFDFSTGIQHRYVLYFTFSCMCASVKLQKHDEKQHQNWVSCVLVVSQPCRENFALTSTMVENDKEWTGWMP